MNIAGDSDINGIITRTFSGIVIFVMCERRYLITVTIFFFILSRVALRNVRATDLRFLNFGAGSSVFSSLGLLSQCRLPTGLLSTGEFCLA